MIEDLMKKLGQAAVEYEYEEILAMVQGSPIAELVPDPSSFAAFIKSLNHGY